MDRRLSIAMYPLGYEGVNPVTPPQLVKYNRSPTPNDLGDSSAIFPLGTIWLKQDNVAGATDQEVWMLVRVVGNVALWIMFASGTGVVLGLDTDISNVPAIPGHALPVAGIINVVGGTTNDTENAFLVTNSSFPVYRHNIYTVGFGNQVQVKLTDSISLPDTNASGSKGVIYLGGATASDRFMHNFGTNNTFLGEESGNFTMSGSLNLGLGTGVLSDTTSGALNSCGGWEVGTSITTGSSNSIWGGNTATNLTTGGLNCVLGAGSLVHMGGGLTTGSNNCIVGAGTASAYNSSESSNILIGNSIPGIITESNKLRIGNNPIAVGTAAGNINQAYISGINGVIVTNPVAVAINSATGQLGVFSGSFASQYTTNDGLTETPSGGNLNVFGAVNASGLGPNINTYRVAADTIGIRLADDITIGKTTTNNTAFSTLAFDKSRIGAIPSVSDKLGEIDFNGINGAAAYLTGSSIYATVVGAAGATSMPTQLNFTTNGGTATPTLRMSISYQGTVGIGTADAGADSLAVTGPVSVLGAVNINNGSGAGSVVINGTGSSGNITLGGLGTGYVSIGNTTGLIFTQGALVLSPTNTAGTDGVFYVESSPGLTPPPASDRFLHYAGTNSCFIGKTSGNFTNTGSRNFSYGTTNLGALTSGSDLTVIGYGSLPLATSAVQNTTLGSTVAASGTTLSYNTIIGYTSGSAYTTEQSNILIQNAGTVADANTIRIGTEGAGNLQQNKCFIAGIFGKTTSDAGSAAAVLIDNTGNLGTVASSERFKENIQDMASHSNDVMKLRPVIFNYKEDKTKFIQYGLIAEEVKEVMPELVIHDQDGRPASVKYHDLPALLLNEIQKLTKRIEKLEELG